MDIFIESPTARADEWTLNGDGRVVDGFAKFLRSLAVKVVCSNLPSAAAAENVESRVELSEAVRAWFADNAAPDPFGPFAGDDLSRACRERVDAVCADVAAGKLKIRRAKKVAPAPADAWDGPVIQLEVGVIEPAVDAAERALSASKRGVYQRSGEIVTTGKMPVKTASGDEISAQRIFKMDDVAVHEAIAAVAKFEQWSAKSEKFTRCAPPSWVARTLVSRTGRLNLPVLSAVVEAPTMRRDGSILDTEGYDPISGMLVDFYGKVWPVMPDAPGRAEAEQALEILKDLVSESAFVEPVDRAVALAAFLTACVRRSIRTAPLFAFTAPTAGSGKSLLVDICSILSSGHEAGVIAQGRDEAEDEKRLASEIMAGSSIIAIDNCTRPLDGDLLCQMLTQTTVKVRVLGSSKTPEFPMNALVCATGNNLIVSGDQTRRVMLSRLDAGIERPELRNFKRDIVAHTKAARGDYVAACLTIMRAYHLAGRPQTKGRALAGFTEWLSWVRDALMWLGEPDITECIERTRELDPKLDAIRVITSEWQRTIGEKRVTAAELIGTACGMRTGSLGQRGEFEFPEFREALLAVAGDGGAVNGRRLGKWLSSNMGRLVNGIRIVRDGSAANAVKWRLEVA